MKAKNTFRPRGRKSEQEQKTPMRSFAGGRSKEKEATSLGGSRFDVLQENEKHVKSIRNIAENKAKVSNKQWRRKEATDPKALVQEISSEVMLEEGNTSLVVDTGSRPMNETFSAEKVSEQLNQPVRVEGKKIRLKKNKNNSMVGGVGRDIGPLNLKVSGQDKKNVGIRKRQVSTRPMYHSQALKRKNASRAHNIVFSDFIQNGPQFNGPQIIIGSLNEEHGNEHYVEANKNEEVELHVDAGREILADSGKAVDAGRDLLLMQNKHDLIHPEPGAPILLQNNHDLIPPESGIPILPQNITPPDIVLLEEGNSCSHDSQISGDQVRRVHNDEDEGMEVVPSTL